ncbi:MAG: hypothetical protein AAB356_09470, partial [Deltaproteobacteria bacterium]
MRRLIAISLIVLAASVGAYYYSLDEASATGGAFPSTKHGGGTTDGATPCAGGVNRGLGDDYGGNCLSATYNSDAEAGKYKSGECTHCHEPHASFGGSEPFPYTSNDAGPDPYLLMKEYGGASQTTQNYANLCWYCHENMFNINGEGSPTGMGRFKFYQGKTVFQASSHNTSTSFYWRGTTGDPQQIWPRQSRSFLPSGNKGSCLNCHTPHGIKATDAANAYDTTAVPAAMQTVASGNPSVMSDYMIPRQLIAWEEALCEGCHNPSQSPIPDIQTEINKNIRSTAAFAGRLGTRYRIFGTGHPVDDTSLAGKHSAGETVPITVKHVECYDCHNPHAVKAPTGIKGDGDGGRITGVKYVDISGFAQEPAPIGMRQPYIYEVCLKCHGGTYKQVFDTAAGTDDVFPDEIRDREGDRGHFSNKRKEFDPNSHHFMNYPAGDIGYNTAYHPVGAGGRNGSLNLCMQLQPAFGLACTNAAVAATELSSLTIQCTDCHNTDASAPAVTDPVTVRGPVTESNLRTTDDNSTYNPSTSPVGPHGSTRNRLLRGNYSTKNSFTGSYSGAGYANNRMDPDTGSTRPKFELCFFCHEESRFIGANTNFGGSTLASWCCGTGSGTGSWNGNLHR